jgi:hypothetical protein
MNDREQQRGTTEPPIPAESYLAPGLLLLSAFGAFVAATLYNAHPTTSFLAWWALPAVLALASAVASYREWTRQ